MAKLLDSYIKERLRNPAGRKALEAWIIENGRSPNLNNFVLLLDTLRARSIAEGQSNSTKWSAEKRLYARKRVEEYDKELELIRAGL